MKITDTPLVSRAVSQRTHEESKLKKSQQKQIEDRRINQPSNAFHQSVVVSGDTYIAEALRKVRESNVTDPESLTRMSGTWIHNRMLNSSQEEK